MVHETVEIGKKKKEEERQAVKKSIEKLMLVYFVRLMDFWEEYKKER